MSTLWLLPLAVGGGGVVLLALANRRLSRQLEALRAALRPLRTRPGAADRERRGGGAS